MPRSIWSGAISFGLVNVPIKMYSAIHESDLHFHYIREKDGTRISYEKVSSKDGKKVPEKEIVKAFEYSKGEYVPMEDKDFEAAAATEQGKTIEIEDFVSYDDIDPIFFERTYHLGPGPGAEKVYTLLATAMDEAGLAAIAKYVMRNKQQLGCLRVRDGAITLEKMYFAEEIRPLKDIVPKPKPRVSAKELDLAKDLIEKLRSPWKPEQYKDTYREALCSVIERKRKGETIKAPKAPKAPEAPDLMELLQASLEQSSSKKQKTPARKRSANTKKTTSTRRRSHTKS
jgi:DNA end-binding protein Ku